MNVINDTTLGLQSRRHFMKGPAAIGASTYSSVPLGATRIPRGRFPKGSVATAVCVAGSMTLRSPEISFVTYTP